MTYFLGSFHKIQLLSTFVIRHTKKAHSWNWEGGGILSPSNMGLVRLISLIQ